MDQVRYNLLTNKNLTLIRQQGAQSVQGFWLNPTRTAKTLKQLLFFWSSEVTFTPVQTPSISLAHQPFSHHSFRIIILSWASWSISRHTCVLPPLVLRMKGWDDGDEEHAGNYQLSAWGLGTVISSHMPHITLPMTLDGEREGSEGGGRGGRIIPALKFQGKKSGREQSLSMKSLINAPTLAWECRFSRVQIHTRRDTKSQECSSQKRRGWIPASVRICSGGCIKPLMGYLICFYHDILPPLAMHVGFHSIQRAHMCPLLITQTGLRKGGGGSAIQ